MKTPALPGLLCLSLFSAAPAADQRPNLIVMLTDDQRAGTLTCYDAKCAIQTPNIDRLARRGMRFDEAFVTTPICCASRASILTGRYASNARVHEFKTALPEFVRKSFLGIAYRKEFNPGGDHNPFLRNYHEKIAGVDRSVGKILTMIETRGIADNTVIVYLSDHGVHFGERRIYGKWTPYDASLRIPLLVSDPRPGAKRDAASARLVLNIDIAPPCSISRESPCPIRWTARALCRS